MNNKPLILAVFASNNLPGVLKETSEVCTILKNTTNISTKILENATIDDMATAIRENVNNIFFFHFGGHSDTNGIVLDALSHLDKNRFTRLLIPKDLHRLQIVFLNGCLSFGQVGILTAKGVKVIIATNSKIDDQEAATISKHFYQNFFQNNYTLKEAFESAEATVSGKNSFITLVNSGEIDTETSILSSWTLFVNSKDKEVLDWKLSEFIKKPLNRYKWLVGLGIVLLLALGMIFFRAQTPKVYNIPKDLKAFSCYTTGQNILQERDPSKMQDAITAFTKSILIEPEFAGNYAGLAEAYLLQCSYEYKTIAENQELIISNIKQSEKKDPLNPQVLTTKAFVNMLLNANLKESEKILRKSLQIDSTFFQTKLILAQCLMLQKKKEEAVEVAKHLVRQNSQSIFAKSFLAWTLMYARKYDDAIFQSERVLGIDANHYQANRYLGKIYYWQRKYDLAIKHFKQVGRISKNFNYLVDCYGIYTAMGNSKAADSISNDIDFICQHKCISDYAWAQLCIMKKDTNNAIRYLKSCQQTQHPLLIWIGVEPNFDALRNNPDFIKIEQSIFK
jgi:tetratricopeptide (TPR) repeat protein